jgi:hypothetical protein
VMELMRWLGPGAELIEPAEWRSLLKRELLAMASTYAEDTVEGGIVTPLPAGGPSPAAPVARRMPG